ncbi:hypothetical protein V1294_006798 [Bradyrhizobium sp. AZCC 1678]
MIPLCILGAYWPPRQECDYPFRSRPNGLVRGGSAVAADAAAGPGYESWQSDQRPASLDLLGQWFVAQIAVRPRSENEIKNIEDKTKLPIDVPGEELTDHTLSLAMDMGMYLS